MTIVALATLRDLLSSHWQTAYDRPNHANIAMPVFEALIKLTVWEQDNISATFSYETGEFEGVMFRNGDKMAKFASGEKQEALDIIEDYYRMELRL